MKLLIHGYGILGRDRLATIAGSKMSGLTLYNSILFEGLSQQFDIAFLAGKLAAIKNGILSQKQLSSGELIFEYDARFPHYLEKNGQFILERAQQMYCRRVEDPHNPIFSFLVDLYLQVIDRFHPDIINVHNLNASSTIVHIARSKRCPLPPIIATIHDTNQEQLNFIARHQVHFTKFVAISNTVFEELTSAGIESEKIELIPNGLVLDSFLNIEECKRDRMLQRNYSIPKNAFKVLIPARRTPEKGIEYAIKAFSDFQKDISRPSCLLISGAGMANPEYEQSLRSYVTQLKCNDSVIFLEPITYNEMPALYAECDVSIIPSVVREGFCYSNLEAMATGRPVVITTDEGGCRDYITHMHNGFLIPPKSSRVIKDSLLYLIQNPDIATDIRTNAKSKAQQYTAKRMVESYLTLIGKLTRLKKVA